MCQIRVFPYQQDVTQIRLDFLRFELAQPNMNGVCGGESFVVAGNIEPTFTVPTICGINTGQHSKQFFPVGILFQAISSTRKCLISES